MDKQEAIERLKQNKAAAEFYAGMIDNYKSVCNELKDIEAFDMAIEALSERTGEWISNHDGSWNCSECGLRVFVYAKGNFCPNCGTRMYKSGGEE